jgi:ribosomal protein S18 acetylase RimI-like enzyme
MKIRIRKVETNELEVLLKLSRDTFFDAFFEKNKPDDMAAYARANFTTQKLQEEISVAGSTFYFAEIEGQAIGYLKLNSLMAQTEFKKENSLEIERIYVLANKQGNKVGEQLLSFAIDQAELQHCEYIWLGVWEHNNHAIRFYERHGFKTFSSHPFMLGSDKQIDILMRKELDGGKE